MSFKCLHTADWQIGKPFTGFGPEKAAVLRRARLDVIDRLAQFARVDGASHVLVAGDVFDSETAASGLVTQLLSRLVAHAGVTWHLISGNHDPARTGSVWDSVRMAGVAANIKLHLRPIPDEIAPGVWLLPAPLSQKTAVADPTAWMDTAATPEGAIRIGIAHGSAVGDFGGEGGEAQIPIDPRRARLANLAYLALGDWHGMTRIGERTWYSGTPEPDRYKDNQPGHALSIEIENNRAAPRVTPLRTAEFDWQSRALALDGLDDIAAFEIEMKRLGAAASRTLVSLELSGRISLNDRTALDKRLAILKDTLFDLALTDARLALATGALDLQQFDGPLRAVAENLSRQATSESAGPAAASRALSLLAAFVSDAEDRA
jgi:DNA repair exonuclease SbcCD nuclease subunit